MYRQPTPANRLLHELRVIPKLITELKQDIERTRSALLSSPQWTDMKIKGGLSNSQEDRTIAIIDKVDYNQAEINRLLERKQEIIQIIMTIPDMVLRHVLIVTYVNSDSYEEAMEKLEIYNRNKFFTLKRKGEESLNLILKNTEKY